MRESQRNREREMREIQRKRERERERMINHELGPLSA